MELKMTIDEAENYLIALKHCETCEAQDINICKACPDYRRGSSAKCYDAIDVGVDIMRKYRRIQKIVRDHDVDNMPKDYWYIDKIREVVEDGKID